MTDEFEEEHFEEKPFLEHLEDLRMTLLKIIVVTVAGAMVCLAVSRQIFSVLKAPIGYSPLVGRYARIAYEGGAPPSSEKPSPTKKPGGQTPPQPDSESLQPGTHIIVTGPLGNFILLARDLFVYSREALSFLKQYDAKADPSNAGGPRGKQAESSDPASRDKRKPSSSGEKRSPLPRPPTAVRASNIHADKVRVTWNASSRATSYEVWRGAKKKPRSASLLTEVTDTSYDDTSTAPGRTYYYWVKAKNSSGTSKFSLRDPGRRLPTVTIIETGPTKGFIVVIKTALICGLGVTMPLNLFFLAQFVFPALTRKEKKYVTPSFLAGGFLFVIGLLFGYFLTLPLALRIFVEINNRYGIANVWRMSEYLGTVTKLLIANGVVFEMPLILIVLVRIGVLSVSTLQKKRRHAIVIILFVAAFLTPMDAATMFMLAVPMLVMYEACIWVSWFLMRKKRQREKEEEERESYWDERRRIKQAEKVEPEKETEKDSSTEPPSEEPQDESSPEGYGEDYPYGDEEWPEEGGPSSPDDSDSSPPDDEEDRSRQDD